MRLSVGLRRSGTHWAKPFRLSARFARRRHDLIDSAKDRLAGFIEHLDLHAVAELHELRLRRAVLDDLQAPLLGNAAVAELRVLVRYGARPDDRARAQVAR